MEPQPNVPPPPPTSEPAKVFIYGTLCAMPLLAWVLTGDGRDAQKVAMVKSMCSPAKVRGYVRRSIHHSDYPAVIRAVDDTSEEVGGFVITFQSASQRRKLDDFEGDLYKPIQVSAEADPISGQNHEPEEVDMYLWDGDMELVAEESWSLDVFINERLEDWLDLFEGMELTG